MNKSKIKVAWLSDSPMFCTGFSTISTNICNELVKSNEYEVFYFSQGYTGHTIPPGLTFKDGRTLNFEIIGQGKEMYFKDILSQKLKELKIDILVILLDTFMVYPWIMKLDLSPAKTVFYFPSDGGGSIPLGAENILKHMNKAISMSEFGKLQVEKNHKIPITCIPHAVDTKNYFPMTTEQKQKLRKDWNLEGKFVIGSVARNQGRKMLDRTIKSFALYAKGNPNAILLLHTDPNDHSAIFPIQNLINRYNIQNRVRFSGMRYFAGFDYSKMNDIYNLMDVFLLTTSGEGFGVPIIEAMAAEIPVLVTDYTTTKELVKDTNSGLAIELVGTTPGENPEFHCNEIINGTMTGNFIVERGICDIKDCAEKLKVLENNELRLIMGKNGRKAVLEKYDWDVVGLQWIEELKKLQDSY